MKPNDLERISNIVATHIAQIKVEIGGLLGLSTKLNVVARICGVTLTIGETDVQQLTYWLTDYLKREAEKRGPLQ